MKTSIARERRVGKRVPAPELASYSDGTSSYEWGVSSSHPPSTWDYFSIIVAMLLVGG
jgi:hypothetical protein